MIKNSFFTFLLLSISALSGYAQHPGTYKDAGLPVPQRVKLLLSQMTVEEKVAQLRSTWSMVPQINEAILNDPEKMDSLFKQGMGIINPDFDNTLEQSIANRNGIQAYMRTKTRLGIPAIFIDEAHHGLLAQQADVFPTSIGLACSWDTLLAAKIYTYVAAQASSRGTGMVLAPVIDVTRDPRWGRTGETFGEDPYLNGMMGSAVVKGFQGSSNGTITNNHVAATLKHFTGHGQPEGGVNQGPADFGPNTLLTFHAEPFRLVIEQVKPAGIMPAYVEVDGVPCSASHWLLTDVLRKEWHYQGVLVSDWWAIDQLYQKHLVAADRKQATLEAFKAGLTIDDPFGNNYTELVSLVKSGQVKMAELDKAAGYVLALKFKLGLFDHQKPIGIAEAKSRIGQPEGRALALEAAEESMVLLKNNNHILPLSKTQYKKIAIIGPCAKTNYTGDYSGVPLHNVSLWEGISNLLKNSPTGLVYAKGVDLSLNGDSSSFNNVQHIDDLVLPNKESNQRKIDSAVRIAKDADVIICAVGENEQFSRKAEEPRHFGDISDLNLQSNQDDLLKALVATGKPVIVYLAHGRPLSVNYAAAHAAAILDGWFTGEESGNAAADILFGDVNPSGKLTISVPRSAGQIPIYYNHKPSAQFLPYVTGQNTPLFSFGYGLSYTTYSYGKPLLNGNILSVNITNTGQTAGDEIVQLYVHPKVASVTQPVKALKGFSRISLKAGESKTVSFTITKDLLAYYNIALKRIAEPGTYELMVGPDSQQVQTVNITIK